MVEDELVMARSAGQSAVAAANIYLDAALAGGDVGRPMVFGDIVRCATKRKSLGWSARSAV
jgi:hypothetical protein